MIEIKSPENIYPGVEANYRRFIQGEPLQYNPDIQAGYSYIKPDHFDQIQGNLAILGLPWCDYIIFTWDKNVVTLNVYQLYHHIGIIFYIQIYVVF